LALEVGLGAIGAEGFPKEGNLPQGGLLSNGQELNQGGFARPVRPDQPIERSTGNIQVYFPQG